MTRPARARWFRCLADVPGVGYVGDPALRARLPQHALTPEVHSYDFDGEESVSLMWPSADGGTSSASPAHEFGFSVRRDESSDQIRGRVLMTLELPGILSDYHFAMQSAAEELWKRRRAEPEQIAMVEWLSWLDVRLIEAHPDTIRHDTDKFFNVAAFERIIGLLEREGFLYDALAAAERFARFRPERDGVAELRERVARLRSEHE